MRGASLLLVPLLLAGCSSGSGQQAAPAATVTVTETRSAAPAPTVTVTETATAQPTEEPSPTATTFTKNDFKVDLKTKSKECFGSAGCSIVVEVGLTYVAGDPDDIPDDTAGEITYEITGGDDGPVIGTLEFEGSKYSEEEESVSTSSGSSKLTAKITDVETDAV